MDKPNASARSSGFRLLLLAFTTVVGCIIMLSRGSFEAALPVQLMNPLVLHGEQHGGEGSPVVLGNISQPPPPHSDKAPADMHSVVAEASNHSHAPATWAVPPPVAASSLASPAATGLPPVRPAKRCVVLVSLHKAVRNGTLPEWNNLAHFLSHGYIPANTSTSMYTSVEYLFLIHIDGVHPRIREALLKKAGGDSIKRPVFHAVPGVPNVQVVVTPRAVADLNMVQYVFPALYADPSIVRYITLNTGTRGPLLPPDALLETGAVRGAHNGSSPYYWVDVVGGERLVEHMGRVGHSSNKVQFARESVAKSQAAQANSIATVDAHSRLVVGTLFSKTIRQHMQSYFLSLPPQAAHLYYGRFMNYANKDKFIVDVEVAFPQRLNKEGFALYAMGQGYSFEAAARHIPDGRMEPNFVSDCPMCCLFTKYGGDIWSAGRYHKLAFVEGAESITTAMKASLLQSIDTSSMASLGRRAAVGQIERALQEHWSAIASASIYVPPEGALKALRDKAKASTVGTASFAPPRPSRT